MLFDSLTSKQKTNEIKIELDGKLLDSTTGNITLKISLDELVGREGYISISKEQKDAINIIKDQINKL